ncbi:MAG: hypothetical protein ACTSUE_14070 [Promethearchaeota archaeon]
MVYMIFQHIFFTYATAIIKLSNVIVTVNHLVVLVSRGMIRMFVLDMENARHLMHVPAQADTLEFNVMI